MNLSFGANGHVQNRNNWRRGILGGLALAFGVVAATPACSLVVDTSTVQCAASSECPSGMMCAGNICIGGGDVICAKTTECTTQLGLDQFCRKDPGKSSGVCRPLKSAECQVVEGDPTVDNVFIIGSIHPTTAPGFDGEIGVSMENSVRLAIQELKQNTNGLPPTAGQTGTRSVVMIGCTDGGESSVSIKAARHLIDNLGAQAIIGGAFSSIAIDTTTVATAPSGVLLVSASATSAALSALSDGGGLLWRTVPSDEFQAKAIVAYMPQLEMQIRTELMLTPSDSIKVALVHKNDAYGNGLKEALQKTLMFNGKLALENETGNFNIVNYGDPDGMTTYAQAIDSVKAQGPHIVLLLGTGEAVSSLYGPIELGWDAALGFKPRYIFSDSNYNTGALASTIDIQDQALQADWRRRTTGVVPGPQENDTLYKIFRTTYASNFSQGDPSILGAASAYDAAYLLFYSASLIQDGVITGKKLAAGLKMMSKAEPIAASIDTGPGKLGDTMNKLLSGEYKSIDYNGAFGPLDFDPMTDDPAANIQVFCLSNDGMGKTKEQLSGLYYEAASQTLKGTFTDACK